MKTYYIILFYLFLSYPVIAEDKCAGQSVLESNCKTKKITKSIGSFLKKGKNIIQNKASVIQDKASDSAEKVKEKIKKK